MIMIWYAVTDRQAGWSMTQTIRSLKPAREHLAPMGIFFVKDEGNARESVYVK